MRWLGEMRVQAARYRAVLRDYLIVAESARADVDKNLAARKADYEKARAKYEPLISSAKERELAAEVEKLWQVFVKSAEDVQTLARKGDLEAAKATNAGKVVPAGRAMDAVMSKMTELNDNGAEASANNANDTYAAASRMMAGDLCRRNAAGARGRDLPRARYRARHCVRADADRRAGRGQPECRDPGAVAAHRDGQDRDGHRSVQAGSGRQETRR